jgi:Ser/Thr protein kinase RdoA (MazF antagonist)
VIWRRHRTRRAAAPDSGTGEVAEAVQRGLGVQATEITPTAGGHHASWYAVAGGVPIVVKVSPLAPFEAWASRAVRAQGVPAAEVLAVEPAERSPFASAYFIARRLSGAPLSTLERLPRSLLREAGDVLRRVHEVVGADFGVPSAEGLETGTVRGVRPTWSTAIVSWTDGLLRHMEGGHDAATADAVRRTIVANAPTLDGCRRSTFLHGDYTPQHIVIDASGTTVSGVLDFAGGQFGAPAYDMAVFSITGPPGDLVALAEGYEADAEARRALLEEVPFYRMVRGVADVAWARMAGVDPSRRLRRLRRFLRELGEDVPEPV